MPKFFLFLLSFFVTQFALEATIPYEVEIEGLKNEDLKDLIKASSQLYILHNSPPITSLGLRKRAESDVVNMITALHSQGYWGAKVDISYDFNQQHPLVIVHIDEGPLYPFSQITVYDRDDQNFLDISPADLGVCLGKAAIPATIRSAEEILIDYFFDQGFPYASLDETELIADLKNETLLVKFSLKKGPRLLFGDVSIKGNSSVNSAYFFKHLAWSKGELYSPQKIKCTRIDLERSGLFTYVDIFFDDTPPPENSHLPITIEVKEGKNRTIGIGASFATQRGLGFSGEWEHRNFQGMGEVLSLKSSLWWDLQVARLSYLQPDLYCKGEDLIWLYEFNREVTEGYTSKSLSAFARIEKKIRTKLKISYGIGFKYLRDTHIHEIKHHRKQKIHSQEFNLLKTPLSAFYNGTDDLLDPHRGMTVRFSTTPSISITDPIFFYSLNTLTYTYYKPLWYDIIFAFRTTVGSIFGAPKTTIPRSELFDAGGDTLLRGYHYKTVSPLDDDHDPTGGRSMLISSFELRWRFSKDFGGVTFFDIGNVYGYPLPDLQEKMLRSVGIGLRYYTLVGPIRLDIAFPITPRRHVDTQKYQIYFSVGQSF